MNLVVVGWLYVALMMAVAEANHPNGTVLGAVFTFLIYGIGPAALLGYLLGHGKRRAARQRAEAEKSSGAPDAGGETPADAVPPVRKEP
jgi:hypothetical protein